MSGGCEMRKTFSFDKFPFILIMHFHFQAKCEYNRLNFKLLMATHLHVCRVKTPSKLNVVRLTREREKKESTLNDTFKDFEFDHFQFHNFVHSSLIFCCIS